MAQHLQWYRSPGKKGSHFNPTSDLFGPKERLDVIVSTTCWFTMIALLIAMACVFGPVPVLKLYGVPYAVSDGYGFLSTACFQATRTEQLTDCGIIQCVSYKTGVCDVARFGDVPSPPWLPGPPLVSRRGTCYIGYCYFEENIPVNYKYIYEKHPSSTHSS